MRAVASVVMNRVRTNVGEYARVSQGGSIRNIIFQPGQFDCVRETIGGRYNSQNIYNMNPTDVHYDIADWAIAGNTLNAVGDCLWYFNPYTSNCIPTFPRSGSGSFFCRIDNHCFYAPTSTYALT